MPYKARVKQGEARKREKPWYRVTNARAYNQSLQKRGMITCIFPAVNSRRSSLTRGPTRVVFRDASRLTRPVTSS
jgi:hypothetical protein